MAERVGLACIVSLSIYTAKIFLFNQSMRTAFPALIKSISIKSLVSGDKEGEIRLLFRPNDILLDGLNRLHKADEEVMVAIVDLAENTAEYSHDRKTVSKRAKRKPEGETEGGEV
jgi:hypothetical protein